MPSSRQRSTAARFAQLLAAFCCGVLVAAGYALLHTVPPEQPLSDGTATPSDHEVAERIELLKAAIADKDRRIAELQRERQSLARDRDEQRAIIRQHALSGEGRAVDDMLALFPAQFPAGDWAPAEGVFEDCWFESVDGLRLHGWYLPHASPRVAILYVHGNAGNLTYAAGLAGYLHRRYAASVFLFDYRGYGRSEGVPSVEGLVRDARAARELLARRERIPPQAVVLLGRSLGGAVAVELAASEGARGLILESTFSSLREVAAAHYPELLVNLLVADRLDSVARIADYHGPLLVSHGDADRTIPFALGRRLFEAANEPKTFVRIAAGDHNTPQGEAYYDALEHFLASLPQP